jgi:hypothetical protein
MADHRAPELHERQVQVAVAFVAGPQPAEVVQRGGEIARAHAAPAVW